MMMGPCCWGYCPQAGGWTQGWLYMGGAGGPPQMGWPQTGWPQGCWLGGLVSTMVWFPLVLPMAACWASWASPAFLRLMQIMIAIMITRAVTLPMTIPAMEPPVVVVVVVVLEQQLSQQQQQVVQVDEQQAELQSSGQVPMQLQHLCAQVVQQQLLLYPILADQLIL